MPQQEEPSKLEEINERREDEEEEVDVDDDNEEEQEVEGWGDWEPDEGEPPLEFLCLFCDSMFRSCDSLFDHCSSTHHFDFSAIRNALALDFCSSFKLIIYIRSQVSDYRCWSCGLTCGSFMKHGTNCRRGRFSPAKLKAKQIIELGAGCSVSGFGMALLGCDVIVTNQYEVLPLLLRNVERNVSMVMQKNPGAI